MVRALLAAAIALTVPVTVLGTVDCAKFRGYVGAPLAPHSARGWTATARRDSRGPSSPCASSCPLASLRPLASRAASPRPRARPPRRARGSRARARPPARGRAPRAPARHRAGHPRTRGTAKAAETITESSEKSNVLLEQNPKLREGSARLFITISDLGGQRLQNFAAKLLWAISQPF